VFRLNSRTGKAEALTGMALAMRTLTPEKRQFRDGARRAPNGMSRPFNPPVPRQSLPPGRSFLSAIADAGGNQLAHMFEKFIAPIFAFLKHAADMAIQSGTVYCRQVFRRDHDDGN